MKEEDQRIAIAEACGRNGWWCPQCKKLVSEYWLGYQNRHANCSESAQQTPDYLHDLNAMHEAIMAQPPDVRMKINDRLMHLIDSTAPYCLDRTINATAAQRAEAFLRTLRKWKEDA